MWPEEPATVLAARQLAGGQGGRPAARLGRPPPLQPGADWGVAVHLHHTTLGASRLEQRAVQLCPQLKTFHGSKNGKRTRVRNIVKCSFKAICAEFLLQSWSLLASAARQCSV